MHVTKMRSGTGLGTHELLMSFLNQNNVELLVFGHHRYLICTNFHGHLFSEFGMRIFHKH